MEDFVCEACRSGIHEHLDAMNQPWYGALDTAGKIDAIDCKTVDASGQHQCCCPEFFKQANQILEKSGTARRRD